MTPGFLAPLNFGVGTRPNSIAVGDFNGDGIPDLAVTNGGSNTVSVLLGKGDGSFQPAASYAAGRGPGFVAVGDFNGDGILDLAVANGTSPGNVSVLLGNGDGSFQPARTFATGSEPDSVAVGDFNGDGILDLALALNDYSVSVLLGNGDGSFQAPVFYRAGSSPKSVAVEDFNGDGIPDLAVANYGDYFQFDPGSVSVLLGNGDGSFQPARDFYAGYYPQSVVVGDFNGDGIPDLATADDGGGTSVLLGNGDGSFQSARTFAAQSNSSSVAVGDFNGDGIPDLAVAYYHPNFGVSVLLGNGDGTFQSGRDFPTESAPKSLALGDFNGDELPDLAVANPSSDDVSILLNDGVWTRPSPGAHSRPPDVGHFSGHGAGLPRRLALGAVAVEAQLAEVTFLGLWPPAPTVPVAGPAPTLPRRVLGGPGGVATSSPAPDLRETEPLGLPRFTAPSRPILDLAFADALANGIEGSLGDNCGAPMSWRRNLEDLPFSRRLP